MSRGRFRAVSHAAACVLGVVVLSAAGCGSTSGPRGAPVTNRARAASRPDTTGVADLPIVEVAVASPGSLMAVLLTGDGGWAASDKAMAAALAAHGVPVVGVDSRAYLMHGRTPDQLGEDLRRILRHYVAAWHRPQVIVAGYSRGAELAPFMVARLPDDLRRRVALVALLGPSKSTSFRFHWVDLVLSQPRGADVPVPPEIEKLRGIPTQCIYGTKDPDAICAALDSTLAQPIARNRGHRVMPDEADWVATTLLGAIKSTPAQSPAQ